MTETAKPRRASRPAEPSPASNSEGTQIQPLQVLLGIVIRPMDTFEKLRESKRGYVWLAFAVAVIAIVVFAIASSSAQAIAIQNVAPPTGSQNGATTRQFQTPSPVLTIGLAVVSALILTLLDYGLRGLVAFASGMLLGGKIAFKDAFRMGVWTTIPYAIRRLVQSVAMALAGGQAAAGLSAALTVTEIRAMPLLNTLLSSFDFYMVWSVLLFGIGTAITARIGKGKVAIAMLFYVGLSVAGILIFFAISSAIGGLLGGGARVPGGG